MGWLKATSLVTTVAAITTRLIVLILAMKPRLKRPRRTVRLARLMLGEAKGAEVVLVVAVAEVEVNRVVRNGDLIIVIIMVEMAMECSIVEMHGCATASAKPAFGITPTLWDFTHLGSVIQAPFLCQVTMIIGSFQASRRLAVDQVVVLMVEQVVGSLMQAKEVLLQTNALLYRKSSVGIKESPLMQPFLRS